MVVNDNDHVEGMFYIFLKFSSCCANVEHVTYTVSNVM